MNERIKSIVEEVNQLNGRIPEHLIDSIFEIHNEIFSIKEVNKGCGTCRRRTFGRLQTFYNENILGK